MHRYHYNFFFNLIGKYIAAGSDWVGNNRVYFFEFDSISGTWVELEPLVLPTSPDDGARGVALSSDGMEILSLVFDVIPWLI